MPHFVLDCSSSVMEMADPKKVVQQVYTAAFSSGLFGPNDIKVRLNPFDVFYAGTGSDDFIHVFANIMEGRTTEQKKDLADRIIRTLKELFPDVPIVSINVRDFEKATYSNRGMV